MAVYSGLDGSRKDVSTDQASRLVVVTQDCDLVKADGRCPFVECLAVIVDAQAALGILANDARFFVLDPSEGLIADRMHVVLVAKDALLKAEHVGDVCGGDSERARRFATWLGARYDRAAIPNVVVDVVVKPLTEAFKKLVLPGKKHAFLNSQLHEVRLAGDLNSVPPAFDLIFLLAEGADEERCVNALAEIIVRAGFPVAAVSPEAAAAAHVCVQTWQAVPIDLFPLLSYWRSTPISLDVYSYSGDLLVGALGLDAETA